MRRRNVPTKPTPSQPAPGRAAPPSKPASPKPSGAISKERPALTPQPPGEPAAEATRVRAGLDRRALLALLCVGLAAGTVAAYSSVLGKGGEFFRIDDGVYLVENEHVQRGLNAESVGWAFTAFHATNWHPLTWLSLTLDHSLHGLADPAGYRFTNVLLHAANAVLLLLVLDSMTKALWPSALAAALFALHPLHVESVAWIAERKDTLSTLFWLLTMAAYVRYARRPGAGGYVLVASLFALGLMSKPMLVTLPCVLLLLDYWPLRRWPAPAESLETDARSASLGWLILEKLPLFALAAADSYVTYLAQRIGEWPTAVPSLWSRTLSAALAYGDYLRKTFLPVDLAPLYTRPGAKLPTDAGIAWLAFLVVATLAALWFGRQRRYLAVGWLWFIGVLAPVSGIIQIGVHSAADRYTYVPHIGLFILLVWGAADLCRGFPKALLGAVAAAILAGCFWLTFAQAKLWRDNIAMWEHAVRVTQDNFGAHEQLAGALMTKGRAEEAFARYRECVRIDPTFGRGWYHFGLALEKAGRWQEAADAFRTNIPLAPAAPGVRFALARCLLQMERLEEALTPLADLVKLVPSAPDPRYELARIDFRRGRFADAEKEARALLSLLGQDERMRARTHDARLLLGMALAGQGQAASAESELRAVLRWPDGRLDPIAAFHLAWALDRQGKIEEAKEIASAAAKAHPGAAQESIKEGWRSATDPEPTRRSGPAALLQAQVANLAAPGDYRALEALAAAFAELGRFDEAQTAQTQAVAAAASKQLAAADQAAMARRLELYKQKQPFRAEMRSVP